MQFISESYSDRVTAVEIPVLFYSVFFQFQRYQWNMSAQELIALTVLKSCLVQTDIKVTRLDTKLEQKLYSFIRIQ